MCIQLPATKIPVIPADETCSSVGKSSCEEYFDDSCYSDQQRCNGYNDCGNGRDESNCMY